MYVESINIKEYKLGSILTILRNIFAFIMVFIVDPTRDCTLLHLRIHLISIAFSLFLLKDNCKLYTIVNKNKVVKPNWEVGAKPLSGPQHEKGGIYWDCESIKSEAWDWTREE